VMDLLVICTESGLSPRAAIDRIAREIAQTTAISAPPLSGEPGAARAIRCMKR
jgi:hypothetical protein